VLDTLILLCANPPSLLESVFPTYDATLIVPCGSSAAYSQHPIWGRFSDINENCNDIDEIESDNIRVFARDGRIVVEGADREEVHVYDMTGRLVSDCSLPTGIYIVRIGNRPAQKVIIF
jgi:hypothetical protein